MWVQISNGKEHPFEGMCAAYCNVPTHECIVCLLPQANVPTQYMWRMNILDAAMGWQDGDAVFYQISLDSYTYTAVCSFLQYRQKI